MVYFKRPSFGTGRGVAVRQSSARYSPKGAVGEGRGDDGVGGMSPAEEVLGLGNSDASYRRVPGGDADLVPSIYSSARTELD